MRDEFVVDKEIWQRQFGETYPGRDVASIWHILQVKEGAQDNVEIVWLQLHNSFKGERQLTL